MEKKVPNLCVKKEECCGCTACATICPVQTIKLEYDSKGFLYPNIDFDKCVGCLKCEKVCAFKKDLSINIGENPNIEIYAVKSKSRDVLTNSSSGGMFTVLSDLFLERGDVVVACKYSCEMNSVLLSFITDKNSRNEARGSKYIQAELGDSFKKIIDFLNKNPKKNLLVVGTGCQIAGLDLLLKSKKLRKQVVLVDLICHGAASSKLWKEYIHKIEIENGGNINYVTFKNKKDGWENPHAFVRIKDKEVSIKPYSDWFYMGWTLRESCYKCPYTRIDRQSDITIGDYWGIQNVMPDFYDKMGVSLVIIHTEVGKRIFEKLKSNIDYNISNRKDCLQPRLIFPQSYPKDRDLFWNDMKSNGIDYCIEKYYEHHENSIQEKIKTIYKKIVKKLKNSDSIHIA